MDEFSLINNYVIQTELVFKKTVNLDIDKFLIQLKLNLTLDYLLEKALNLKAIVEELTESDGTVQILNNLFKRSFIKQNSYPHLFDKVLASTF
jgi:hypothetical protein